MNPFAEKMKRLTGTPCEQMAEAHKLNETTQHWYTQESGRFAHRPDNVSGATPGDPAFVYQSHGV